MECIFCKIVKGEIPSKKIFENENCLAFLDIHPANIGHTLVIPKEHYPTFNSIPTMVLQDMISVVQKISRAMDRAIPIDGYNILMNNHKAAGQLVPHAHFHIIPRIVNDKVHISLGEIKFNDITNDLITSIE